MNNTENRSFQGIWIPKELWLNNELSVLEKVLFVEIQSLEQNEKEGCYATNEHFSKLLGVSERQVQRFLNHLRELGLIKQNNSNSKLRVLKMAKQKIIKLKATKPRQKCRSNHDKNVVVTTTKMSPPIYIDKDNHIDNHIDIEKSKKEEKFSFEKIWDIYKKKVGDKEKLKAKWNKLSEEEKAKAFEHIPLYVENTPDKKYRKNFETYLNNKSFNDEIISQTTKQTKSRKFSGEYEQW